MESMAEWLLASVDGGTASREEMLNEKQMTASISFYAINDICVFSLMASSLLGLLMFY